VGQGCAAATCSIYPNTRLDRNYDELYPSSQWKDPATYVYTLWTVEESIVNGIASRFTYYMDERDQEWLDRKMRRLAEKA
jgi:enhancer of polycomb-like protein